MTPFSSKEELREFIQGRTPFLVKPTKKAKTTFVAVFTSEHSMNKVVEGLTDALWKKLNG
jgi:hypothetical protein